MITASDEYQQSARMTAAITGLAAAGAEVMVPETSPVAHALTVGSVAAAAVGVSWITADSEVSYDQTSTSLYIALALAAATASIVSYALRGVSKMARAAAVGVAVAAALLVSRHERDSGLVQWSRFQYFSAPSQAYSAAYSGGANGGGGSGAETPQILVSLAKAAADQKSSSPVSDQFFSGGLQQPQIFAALEADKQVSDEYLPLPTGGWDKSDLTDSKRPSGWMMDKYCRAHEYVNCPSCKSEGP